MKTKKKVKITAAQAFNLLITGRAGDKRLEKEIARSAKFSYEYAKSRRLGFLMGEDAISRNAWYSYLYALNIIEGRWEKGEPAIAKSEYALSYAEEFFMGEGWEKAENTIIKSVEKCGYSNRARACLRYAKVINGRLPIPMHNAMIIGAFNEDGDEEDRNDAKKCVKEYLEFLKSREDQIVRHLSLISEEARQEIMRRAKCASQC